MHAQVGTGDRSEKIKTYNYKDSRVSDHRLKLNFDLTSVMEGDLEDSLQVRYYIAVQVCMHHVMHALGVMSSGLITGVAASMLHWGSTCVRRALAQRPCLLYACLVAFYHRKR